MMLSAICLDYGRPEHLTEALACFLRQDYQGERELVIFNSFPKIQYRFEHPNVRVVNCQVRPPSLGDCRNLAIVHAKGTHLLIWDSDDLFLSHYLSTVARHFKDNDWIWQSHNYYALNWRIAKIVTGQANVVCYTKSAWERAGKYKPLGTGEDRNFVSRLTANTKGCKAELAPDEIGYVYCWQNSAWHISGAGDDAPGKLTSYRRSEMELERRVRERKIKTGEIVLVPALKYDYDAQAKAYLTHHVKPPGNLAVVLLGKYGDIINALPILKRLSERGGNPHVIVSKAFASIFDGVSYVTPVPVDFRFEELLPVMKLAQSKFSQVLRLQVYGRGHVQQRVTSSYNQEPWAEAGMLDEFHNPALKPVFDKRDSVRERGLVAKVFNTHKPKIVTNLLYAASSPFALGRHVLAAIMLAFRETHEVLDITKLKLHRIYDLLAIIEKAELFVSIDTAALHLAAATDTPVLALVNDTPWLGSAIRYNDVAVLPYKEANPKRVVEVMREAIRIGKHLEGIAV